MAQSKYWGTYGASSKFELDGWYVEVGSFEYTSPASWAGKTSWRYRMSRNRIVSGIWTDKNPRARKFETRCFVSRQEAEKAARDAVEKQNYLRNPLGISS